MAVQSAMPLDIDVALLREQSRATLASSRILLRSSILVTLSAGAIVYIGTGNPLIFAWLAVALTLVALRLLQIARFSRLRVDETDPRLTLRRSWQSALAQGLLWAVLPFAILGDGAEGELALLGFIFAGTTAGSVIQNRAYAPTGVAYVVPSLVGLILWCIWFNSYGSLILAVNVALLLGMMVQNLRSAERAFRATHTLRFEATALAESLDRAREQEVAARDELSRIASTDPLTGLDNRAAFNTALADACRSAAADGGRFALLVVDLDRFKTINDTLGHIAGDAVLVEAARTIRSAVRERGTVARLGGDEFAVLILGDTDDRILADVAERIVSDLAAPIRIAGRPTMVGASVGVAVYPDDAAGDVDLLARADIALYAAKDLGRRRWKRFDERLRTRLDERRRLELDLCEALKTGAVTVHFQPQVSLPGGTLVGVEALLRWRHPTLGWVPPPDIVDAANTVFLSERLTETVLQAACDLSLRLDRLGLGRVPIAINVSPREFAAYSPAELIETVLARNGIAPHLLEIEITEEAFLDTAELRGELERLVSLGTRIAIDDFGAGHASLAYLASLHVDRIKIDRRFVSRLGLFDRDRFVIEAILGIGRVLNVKVTAEGVETPEQARILAAVGCREAQGYNFGRPMPADDLIGRIESGVLLPHPSVVGFQSGGDAKDAGRLPGVAASAPVREPDVSRPASPLPSSPAVSG